jgi:hypothetical protein
VGEYVSANVPEVLSAANDIATVASELTQAMDGLIGAIERAETQPEVLPRDSFTEAFLGTYHQQLPDEGGQLNVAVRENASSMGPALTNIAQYVRDGMFNYAGTDDDSADSLRDIDTES